ncbi:MAG: hypothetical protein J5493_02075 [Lachnospiraceae bacterium]|nr:hypothetical protein [Lachnospiraceae bacterium]
MGRRVQQLDTLENIIYVLVCLLMTAAALLCLIKGTLHYVWLIAGGAGVYFLTGAVSEFVRAEKGFWKRGLWKTALTLLLALFTWVAKVCL